MSHMGMIHLRAKLLAAIFTGSLLAILPAAAQDGGALIAAVQDGLTSEVDVQLAHHANVNAIDSTGATALSWAVMRGEPDMVMRLLKAHADPNIADANGVTPLMLAIDSNAPDMVKALLAARADANAARADGETPLMHAVHIGSSDMVAMLLAAKADVNARESQFDQTALMWAPGHPDIAKLLLAHGADIHAVTRSWQTSSVNYISTVSTIGITGIPWNNEGEYSGKAGGSNALLFAVQAGDADTAKLLLDAGMDVNEASADGTTPLLAALYNWSSGDTRIGQPSLKAGGGRGVTMQFTPHMALANMLLDRGARIDASDRAGYTPLHGAVLAMVAGGKSQVPQIGFQPGKRGMANAVAPKPPRNEEEGLKLVARMLAMGADPNKTTANTTPGPVGSLRVNPASAGSTPFHLAGYAHSAALIELMAAHGANPNLVRKDGHTPFSLAVMSDDLPVVQAMVAHGADVTMRFNPADKIADPVKPVAEMRKDETILHIAAIPGSSFVVEYLASKGAPLNAKNDHGETPLDLADAQERFRYARDEEEFLANRRPKNLDGKIVRETQTSDAFKRAMGLKTTVASN